MHIYRLRRISLVSAAKFAMVIGVVVSLLPAILSGVVFARVVGATRELLVNAAAARVTVLGQAVPIDLVQLLRLGPVSDTFQALNASGTLLAVCVALAVLAAASGSIVIAALAGTCAYNVTARLAGGLKLELEEEPAPLILPPSSSSDGPSRLTQQIGRMA